MNNSIIIIGLTGRFGAGCTTTAEFFKKQLRFKYFTLSDSLKREAKRSIKGFNGKPEKEKREFLQNLGDQKRKTNLAALANPIIREIKRRKPNNVVIDSIRNPEEVQAFKKAFGSFTLLAIDAEVETRFKRLANIYGDDRKQFKRDDERDKGEKEEKYGQKVKECIEMSDILINNEATFFTNKGKKINKTIDEYGQKLSDYCSLICNPGNERRPNSDELHMHFASSLAFKSNCLHRQVGAIVVHEKGLNKAIHNAHFGIPETYVVSTGCNNVPIGEKDCGSGHPARCYRDEAKDKYYKDSLYCRKCGEILVSDNLICNKCTFNNKKTPGKWLDICRAVHAEEAAILQAAKLGSTSLDGTTLYTSTFPCMLCCKSIINSGIKKIIYLESYPMEESQSLEMFRNCNIEIKKFEGVNTRAFHKFFKKNY